MKERPILFSSSMVRAILAGRKTQTRRIMNPQPEPLPTDHPKFPPCTDSGYWWSSNLAQMMVYINDAPAVCPFGLAGERLWVRETWADLRGKGFDGNVGYRADTPEGSDGDEARKAYGIKWRPSIHMPRWASRIMLEITNVRVERLKDISEDDAIAEGCPKGYWTEPPHSSVYSSARQNFESIWDSIHSRAPYGPTAHEWASNPWVWVIEFRRIK